MTVVTERPAAFCEAMLSAIASADGRRRQRKRDQTPDTIGLDLRRSLLARVVAADPDALAFEAWLFEATRDDPAYRAVVPQLLEEWRLVRVLPAFAEWLEHGAPSADADGASPAQ